MSVLDPKFFFMGKLAREEATSAFLATLLEDSAQFRESFLRELTEGEESRRLLGTRWEVDVEKDCIDVTLRSEQSEAVLIENKIQSGSVQRGQLRRYYEAELGRGTKRIAAVLLAPRAIGQSQVDGIKAFIPSGRSDFATAVSWETVKELLADPALPEEVRLFAANGMTQVQRLIDSHDQARYELVGPRLSLQEIVEEAGRELASIGIGLQQWRGRDFHQLFTTKSDLSVWLNLRFEAQQQAPFAPLCERPGGRFEFEFLADVRLSAAGKRKPEKRASWAALSREDELMLAGLPPLKRSPNGWFHTEPVHVSGSREQVRARFVELGMPLLRFAASFEGAEELSPA